MYEILYDYSFILMSKLKYNFTDVSICFQPRGQLGILSDLYVCDIDLGLSSIMGSTTQIPVKRNSTHNTKTSGSWIYA